jgi:hypothetical protein
LVFKSKQHKPYSLSLSSPNITRKKKITYAHQSLHLEREKKIKPNSKRDQEKKNEDKEQR